MRRTFRIIPSLALAATFAMPVALLATPAPAPQDARYYDRDHKDYHQWDDHERAAWGRFLAENHRKDHEFAKANRREQNEYWAWRHGHPD